jgi:23S rRNA (adenine2503-C2)-methyltransferase
MPASLRKHYGILWRNGDNGMDSPSLDPRDQSPADFFERARRLSLPPGNARRWLALAIGRGECGLAECGRRGILPRRFIEQTCELPRLRLEKQLVSSASKFQKLVFRTADDLLVECVLIPLHRPGAFSICLSSQIGCVMRCSYCATGRMSAQRDLQTWEIIDQFVQARAIVRLAGGCVTGAVFMGMGEPFLNYDRVLAAAELLRFPIEAAIRAEAITISTVGLVSQIDRFTSEDRRFRLSISLGAATDEKRKMLLPIAARTSVAEIMEAARRHARSRRTRVMLSYVCIGGVNVSVDDARALGDLINDTPVRIDLIDVNEPTGRYLPPTADELNGFRDALRRYVGQPVVRRYSGGSDIGAACGSLGEESAPSTICGLAPRRFIHASLFNAPDKIPKNKNMERKEAVPIKFT